MTNRDDLDQTLDLFLEMLCNFFGRRLTSILLYGSVVFGDLAPGYGDLDFLAVIDDDLTDQECRGLIELRKPLRDGTYGILATMLEGAFLPRAMLAPRCSGTAFSWGTSGERTWVQNQLGWLTLDMIRKHSTVVWGEDIRHEIPVAGQEVLLDAVWMACQTIRQHGRGGGLHSVDWLLTAARLLLWLQEGRFSSKSEAAEWGSLHATGEWHNLLSRARQIRLNPQMASSASTQAWLKALTEPIQEACTEVEQALARYKKRPSQDPTCASDK
jgi:hypothetical protein